MEVCVERRAGRGHLGARTPYGPDTPWPARVDEFLVDGLTDADVDRWVRGACLLCSHGCGLEVAVKDGRIVGVRGRAEDRINHGRLGPKALCGWQGEQHDRLTTPLVREGGELVEVDWETAMSRVVERSRSLLDSKGPLSHAFFTSGQLMIEEYYTLAVIGKAGISTPHMDGNTRWCTVTAAAALQETFGSDGQANSYTDIDACDAVFLFGHNVAETEGTLGDSTEWSPPAIGPTPTCTTPASASPQTAPSTPRRCARPHPI